MHAFIVSCFAACSEHVYSEYFHKSSETIARQAKQTTAHTRTRERAVARRAEQREEEPSKGRNSRAKAGTAEQREERLTKRREIGLGALPRLQMHKK